MSEKKTIKLKKIFHASGNNARKNDKLVFEAMPEFLIFRKEAVDIFFIKEHVILDQMMRELKAQQQGG